MDVAEQAVWALGNIAGDGPATRDMVLSCGVMKDLLDLIKPDSSVSLIRNTVWAISNLCRNKVSPSFMFDENFHSFASVKKQVE